MANDQLSRRDALKLLGVGATTFAAASFFAPVSQARDMMRISFPQNPVRRKEQERVAQRMPLNTYKEKEVYSGPDVIIRQIDEHTWEGNGHLMSNETIYIIEGSEKAILLDMGTKIEDLDKIVAGITSKPIIPVATHVHPDHTGSAINYFPELWINAGDMVNVPSMMGDYKGKINYLADGQVFDLGGREIEVIFTPGHTPGSVTLFDKKAHYGFSGDAFGSGNLLLMTNFSTLLSTTTRIETYMKKYSIEKLYPGHYFGVNAETLQRVSDLKTMSQEVLDGKRTSNGPGQSAMGLNASIKEFGVTVNYKDPQAVK